jgi:protein-S-isoprenylcysteine O-methyltransferase Ste14
MAHPARRIPTHCRCPLGCGHSAEISASPLEHHGRAWLAHYVVAALDLGRFHWSRPLPLRAQGAGLLGLAAALSMLFWATSVNPFFSSVIRIQRDRGHRGITVGPYRYVRHPGYAAAIVLVLSSALALGSRWSLPPAILASLALIRRTLVEDRVLREELERYAPYAEHVRYRLVPTVW